MTSHRRMMSSEHTPDKTRKPLKRKRSHVTRDSDTEEGASEGPPQGATVAMPHQSLSEMVKVCHWTADDFTVNEERKLQRLATRGVVQLFNAVRKHQKSIEDKLKEVGQSERKKHKVLSSVDKGGFIDMLKGASKTREKSKEPSSQSTEPTWSILREDYLKNSKLQDWDKEDDVNDSGSDSGSE